MTFILSPNSTVFGTKMSRGSAGLSWGRTHSACFVPSVTGHHGYFPNHAATGILRAFYFMKEPRMPLCYLLSFSPDWIV